MQETNQKSREKITLGEVFLLNVCIVIFAWEQKNKKRKKKRCLNLEKRCDTMNKAGPMGREAQWCAGAGIFYFETPPAGWPECVWGPWACRSGGAHGQAGRLQQLLLGVRLQNGQGILLFRQITALDDRTETHRLISARLTFQSLRTHQTGQKWKETRGWPRIFGSIHFLSLDGFVY